STTCRRCASNEDTEMLHRYLVLALLAAAAAPADWPQFRGPNRDGVSREAHAPARTPLVITNGRLYIRVQDNLICYDVRAQEGRASAAVVVEAVGSCARLLMQGPPIRRRFSGRKSSLFDRASHPGVHWGCGVLVR